MKRLKEQGVPFIRRHYRHNAAKCLVCHLDVHSREDIENVQPDIQCLANRSCWNPEGSAGCSWEPPWAPGCGEWSQFVPPTCSRPTLIVISSGPSYGQRICKYKQWPLISPPVLSSKRGQQ